MENKNGMNIYNVGNKLLPVLLPRNHYHCQLDELPFNFLSYMCNICVLTLT